MVGLPDTWRNVGQGVSINTVTNDGSWKTIKALKGNNDLNDLSLKVSGCKYNNEYNSEK